MSDQPLGADGSELAVSVENHSGVVVPDEQFLGVVAAETLCLEGVVTGSLDIHFVGSGHMTDLNATHMNGVGPTDVLAFPMDAPQLAAIGPRTDNTPAKEDVPLHLGDVVICPEVAETQAPSHAGNLGSEYCLLVVHAVLHLLGYDHAEPEERQLMQGREKFHLGRYGHRHPKVT